MVVNYLLIIMLILLCQPCNYHLWSLRHIQKFLTVDIANTITCSMVGFHLDYCNYIFNKTTKANKIELERVQKNFACVIWQKLRHTHAEDLAVQLHHRTLAAISYCVERVIALITHKALTNSQPRYLADFLLHHQPVHALRFEDRCQLG